MKQVFKDNPRLDVCYETADGKHFFLENDARNYASNLENKTVKKLMRGDDTSETIVEVVKQVLDNAVVEVDKTEKETTETTVEPTKKTPKTKK